MGTPTQGNPLGIDGTWQGNYEQPDFNRGISSKIDDPLIGGCPSYNCGGSLMRIGSSVYGSRCTSCGRQYDLDQFGDAQPMDSDLVPVDKYKAGKIGQLPWT
jgi:hypothetical protein